MILSWTEFLEAMRSIDYRDLSDDANRWADDESVLTAVPENVGEWKASVAIAFEAGRRWERARAAEIK